MLGDGRFTHQEGQIVRRPDDTGWRYMLEAASYFTPPAVPDQAALLAGLSDNRAEAVITTVTYEWVHRVDPAVVALKGAGFWAQPHAWVSLFVPASRAAEFATFVTSQLTPPDLGAGLAIYFPIATARLTRPLMVVPRGEPAAFQFSLLRFPFPFPGQPSNEAMLAQNRAFFDKAVELGGNRYIIGAVPNMTPADWQHHYGAVFPFFQRAKAANDPDRILDAGPAHLRLTPGRRPRVTRSRRPAGGRPRRRPPTGRRRAGSWSASARAGGRVAPGEEPDGQPGGPRQVHQQHEVEAQRRRPVGGEAEVADPGHHRPSTITSSTRALTTATSCTRSIHPGGRGFPGGHAVEDEAQDDHHQRVEDAEQLAVERRGDPGHGVG